LSELEKLTDFNIYIGKVKYLLTKQIEGDFWEAISLAKPKNHEIESLYLNLMLLKRMAFEYEDEIRIFVMKKSTTEEKGIPIKFEDLSKLILRVTIHPTVKSHTENLLKEIFKNKYHIGNVVKSQLYTQKTNVTIKI
jgi:hypothetical protein